MTFKQGDIVVVPFPYTDLVNSKRRPAVVVSNQIINSSRDVILAQITTRVLKGPNACKITNGEVVIPFKPPHSEMYISCNKVAVIEKSLIVKKITSINSDAFLNKLLDKVKQNFNKD